MEQHWQRQQDTINSSAARWRLFALVADTLVCPLRACPIFLLYWEILPTEEQTNMTIETIVQALQPQSCVSRIGLFYNSSQHWSSLSPKTILFSFPSSHLWWPYSSTLNSDTLDFAIFDVTLHQTEYRWQQQVYNLYLATAPDWAYHSLLCLSSQKPSFPADLPC